MSFRPQAKIQVLDLQKQYQQVASELEQAVLEVLRSGSYILGKNLSCLESEIASLCGCRYGIGVANGTDALTLALWGLEIGPGDEVITPPFTFAATAEAIVLRGAKPVFVDIDPKTFNINARLIESKITPRTRAILPVHLYGQPAAMEEINEIAHRHNLKVIEDNAQAIGAHYYGKNTGSLSDVACISFYPTKNLGAAGDAGMLVTNNSELANKLRMLRAHGSHQRYYHEHLGVNSRLDEIQAAVLLTKLPYLSTWNQKRQNIATLYEQLLGDFPYVTTPYVAPDVNHVWHQYTVRINGNSDTKRDLVKHELFQNGIDSMCYYPLPLHLQPAFSHLGHRHGDYPVSETAANEVLSLPMYPELTEPEIEHVAKALKKILTAGSSLPVSTPTIVEPATRA